MRKILLGVVAAAALATPLVAATAANAAVAPTSPASVTVDQGRRSSAAARAST